MKRLLPFLALIFPALIFPASGWSLGACASVSTILGNVVRAQSCPYSAYGVDKLLTGEANGRLYDVYYLTGNASAVGPVMVYGPGVGWAYVAGNISNTPGAEAIIKTWLTPSAAFPNPPVAFYYVRTNSTALRYLSAPISAGATSIPAISQGAGFTNWPSSSTPNYSIVLDQGLSNQESVNVTAQTAVVSLGFTMTSGATANAHNTINITLGNFTGEGTQCATSDNKWASGGCGGTPGTAYSFVFGGGGCSTQPTATYNIETDGTIHQGSVTVTSNGIGCTSAPTIAFSAGTGGWPNPCTATTCYLPSARAFFSSVLIAETQWPAQINDVSAFASYLGQCAAGGLTPGTGACPVASTNPAPGNPMDQRWSGDSSAAQLATVMGQVGNTLLDTTFGHPSYSEWAAPWKVTKVATWSVPDDIAYGYNFGNSQAPPWGYGGLVGPVAASTYVGTASPSHNVSSASAPMLQVNGTADAVTPSAQVLAFNLQVPNTSTPLIVTSGCTGATSGPGGTCPHELDLAPGTWLYPGLTLGPVYCWLFCPATTGSVVSVGAGGGGAM
jgi:hypothetical protein